LLHVKPISSFLTWSFRLYLAKSTNYETPHYAVFLKLLSPYLSLLQVFSSACCSQTLSVCRSAANKKTKRFWTEW
jgi:hypothetical protein